MKERSLKGLGRPLRIGRGQYLEILIRGLESTPRQPWRYFQRQPVVSHPPEHDGYNIAVGKLWSITNLPSTAYRESNHWTSRRWSHYAITLPSQRSTTLPLLHCISSMPYIPTCARSISTPKPRTLPVKSLTRVHQITEIPRVTPEGSVCQPLKGYISYSPCLRIACASRKKNVIVRRHYLS